MSPEETPTPSPSRSALAEEVVSLRAEGRWAELGTLLKGNRPVAENAVAIFRTQTDEVWARAVNRLTCMGLLQRGMGSDIRTETANRLKKEVDRLDTAAAECKIMPLDSTDLVPLSVLRVDDILAAATAKATVHRISTPLDGSHSKYKIYYRQFDRGSKMDVYEPVGVVVAEAGSYKAVQRTDLPEEVRNLFFWYRDNIIVKAVRAEDSYARGLNEQVDEGYMVAGYCLDRNAAFVNTTVFRYQDSGGVPDAPSGVSLIIHEASSGKSGQVGLRPIYLGQQGMVVVVQRRAPSTHIRSVFDVLKRTADESVKQSRKELEAADTFFRRLTVGGRARIAQHREAIHSIEAGLAEDKQFIVSEYFKPFKEFMARDFGVTDLDPDFERNYSLKFRDGMEKNWKSPRDAISHIVSFDFDQFRTLKGFNRNNGRLPDVFEDDTPEPIGQGIRQAQLKALNWL